MLAVVTNIDADHLSTYEGDFRRLRQTFVEFLHHLPFYGLAVMCVDDPNVRDVLPELTRQVRSYGIDAEDADIRAVNLRQQGQQMSFDILQENHPVLGVVLNLPGRHNVLNALAAVAVARELDVADTAIQHALETFEGIARRFQINGEVEIEGGSVLLIDDYGHHPREIAATLEAVRNGWPERRLVVAFQPHRYSRTFDLFDDFAQELVNCDLLLITEVFAAGESPITGADGRALCRAVRGRGRVDPVFVEDVETLPAVLKDLVQPGDVVLTLGAGSIGAVAAALSAALSEKQGDNE
jgi:UDP-N-acetylmuramate--alanine ligase